MILEAVVIIQVTIKTKNMREIKFRAKDKTGQWNKGYLSKDFSGTYYITTEDGQDTYFAIPETIGQFIGLKDKNGTEIYEGDWIRSAPGYCSYIEFKEGAFMSIYKHPEDGEELFLDELGNDIEVIGNIHSEN